MVKYKLAQHAYCGLYKNQDVFGTGSKQYILPKNEWRALVLLASMWKVYKTEKSIREEFVSLYPEVTSELLEINIARLRDGYLIAKEPPLLEGERYQRNTSYYSYFSSYPRHVQKKIQNSKVVLLGCGGIGNLISHMLVNSGVGEITLVDADIVELSNLNRQSLFTEADIGRKKITALRERLQERNCKAHINSLDLNIEKQADLEKLQSADLLVVSADTPNQLIFWINKFCVDTAQAYINVGYLSDIAVIGPFYIPQKHTACFECRQLTPFQTQRQEACLEIAMERINNNFKNLTHPATNGLAASYAFMDIAKFLGGLPNILSVNRRIGIHTDNPSIELMELIKNPACKICSKTKS